jgi:murein DD-endopeptidase MepM/ murein hydrolase activator NlpD
MAAAGFSLAAIGAVGLMVVGLTTPAQAVAGARGVSVADQLQLAANVTSGTDDHAQTYVTPANVGVAAFERDGTFATGTLVELAGTIGITMVSNAWYTNNASCAVQWPFAVGVPISSGYGPRPGTKFHEGDDFTPGRGAHVQAISDGVVRVAQNSYIDYGVTVIIDHVIDGQKVSTLYGHMEVGSLQVQAGEKVQVGQYIGRTGSTGFSTGPHTHVEVWLDGITPTDPLPWLRAHNQC